MGARRIWLIVAVLVVAGLWAGATPLSNLMALTFDRGWALPPGASVWTFRETMRNQGSGEWWMYGEDPGAYYYNGVAPPRVLPRDKAEGCAGFDRHDASTWDACA